LKNANIRDDFSYTTFAFVKNVCFKSLQAFKNENSKMLFLDPRISTKRISFTSLKFLATVYFHDKSYLERTYFQQGIKRYWIATDKISSIKSQVRYFCSAIAADYSNNKISSMLKIKLLSGQFLKTPPYKSFSIMIIHIWPLKCLSDWCHSRLKLSVKKG